MLGAAKGYAGVNEDFRRRLALALPRARSSRGATAAYKAIAGAATGSESVISPWVVDAFVLDESTMDFLTLPSDSRDTVHVAVVCSEDSAAVVAQLLSEQAASVADDVIVQRCHGLVTFKHGVNGWSESEVMQDSGVATGLLLEPEMRVVNPLELDSSRTSETHEVSLSIDNGGQVQIVLCADSALDNGYVASVTFDFEGQLEIGRYDDGVYTTVGTYAHRVPALISTKSSVHLRAVHSSTSTKFKVVIDGVDSGWITDSSARPNYNLAGFSSLSATGVLWMIKQVEAT